MKITYLGYGILTGFVISNIAMFFRMTNNKLREEMIYYLQNGDLSIFLGLAYISFMGIIISAVIDLFFKRKRISLSKQKGNNKDD